jgi:hypothetical protein
VHDHRLVARLLDLAGGDAERIVEGALRAGVENTLRIMFGELLPRLDGEVTIGYDLRLPGHEGDHRLRLLPAKRQVVIGGSAPDLRLSHDAGGFVELYRALLGGRPDLGAAVFGGLPGSLARTIAASFGQRPGLGELAKRYGSCKWGAHWGPELYERYLAPLRDRRLTILEIGVGGHHVAEGGESLRMWRDYFPRALIHGVDLYDKRSVQEQRIRIHQGDQGDREFLARLAAEVGPLDVVIDDGSHVNEHVITSFNALFPLLNEGGLYLIEDLQSSYWPAFGGNVADRGDPRTTIGFLKTLFDGLQHQEFLHPPDYEPTYLDRNVAGVHLHHLFAVVEKGANDQPSSKANWMRYLDLERPMAALEIGP